MTLDEIRAWYAEDVRVTLGLASPLIEAALAAVPRERFVGAGPWTIVGGTNPRPRLTDTADPRHVYHNVSIAIDPRRHLYNGQPGVLASWIDDLAVAPGESVLHIGCGTGYYTAVLAEIVGASGRVVAIEADEDLAGQAATNLAAWPWVDVRHGDGRAGLPHGMNVILVNAGATHPLDEWLDRTTADGRLLVPLTVPPPGAPPTLGKGVVLFASRAGASWRARLGHMVMIYSLTAGRDEAAARRLAHALQSGSHARVNALRRDPHPETPDCWLHTGRVCLGWYDGYDG